MKKAEKEAVRRFFEHDVHQRVVERMRHQPLIVHTSLSLTIGKNTQRETVLTRNPDGTIDTGTAEPKRVCFASLADNPLKIAWDTTYGEALEHAKYRTNDVVRERGEYTQGRDTGLLAELSDEERERWAKQIAHQVCATLAGGTQARSPAKLGMSLISDFVGKERARETLRLAGRKATIFDLNAITVNREACFEAHRRNPNATLIFFGSLLDETENQELATSGNAPDILDAAQARFQKAENGPTVWETLGKLNAQALRNHSMDTLGRLAGLVRICQVIESAGALPSATALNTLLSKEAKLIVAPEGLLTAYIKESAKPARERKHSQKDMAKRVRFIADDLNKVAMQFHMGADTHGVSATSDLPENRARSAVKEGKPGDLTWNEILSLKEDWDQANTPQAAKGADIWKRIQGRRPGTPEKTHRKPRSSPKGPPARQPRRRLTPRDFLELAKAAPRVERDIDRVSITDAGKPVLSFHREPSGAITGESGILWSQEWRLPPPVMKPPTMWQATPKEGQRQTPQSMGTAMNAYCRRAQEITGEKGTQALRDEISAHMAEQKVRDILQTDEDLTRELQSAVSEMLEPGTWDAALELGGEVTVRTYNNAARAGEHLPQFAKRTPGAAAWLVAAGNLEEKVMHPGQLTAVTRESAERAGLEPRAWRHASTTPAHTITSMLGKDRRPGEVTRCLNASAQANVRPSRAVAEWVMDTTRLAEMRPNPNPTMEQEKRRNENISAVIQLMVKEPRPHQETPVAVRTGMMEITDYVRHLTNQGLALRSKTWRGLAKASRRWHRELQERNITLEWDRILNSQGGRIYAWNSLLQKTTLKGFEFTPLTDQEQLREEATAMSHCVVGYGTACKKGDSRIFRMKQDGQHMGTVEIRRSTGPRERTERHGERWTVSQAKGPHNHPLSSEAGEAAQKLAEAYQMAWQRNPGSHTEWEKQPALVG